MPLLRPLGRFGSLSALCIGSITPDMAFIVPLDLAREQTHGLAALLTFCLPAGVVAYLLFHHLLKAPLLALLPDCVAGKFSDAKAVRQPWRAVVVSLLCGAATHLVWDAFTHPGTPVVDALPLLRTELADLGGYKLYGFKLLQHGSSLLGLALLACWSISWLKRTPATPVVCAYRLSPAQRYGTLAVLLGGPLLIGLMAGLQRRPVIANMVDLQAFAAGFIFTALPTAALLVSVASVLWHVLARSRPRPH